MPSFVSAFFSFLDREGFHFIFLSFLRRKTAISIDRHRRQVGLQNHTRIDIYVLRIPVVLFRGCGITSLLFSKLYQSVILQKTWWWWWWWSSPLQSWETWRLSYNKIRFLLLIKRLLEDWSIYGIRLYRLVCWTNLLGLIIFGKLFLKL